MLCNFSLFGIVQLSRIKCKFIRCATFSLVSPLTPLTYYVIWEWKVFVCLFLPAGIGKTNPGLERENYLLEYYISKSKDLVFGNVTL